MAIKTGLEGKPWYYGAIGGLLFGGVILTIGYLVKFKPMGEEIEARDRQLGDLQKKIQEGRAAELQLPQFREQVRSLELELDKLLRILPARRNTPDLLRRIRALAEQGDFTLKRFTPGTLSERDFFSEWPIAVSVEATYHNLALFFDRISRFSRIINIENLNLTALQKGDEAHTVAATFTAKTFVYKEPSPDAPASTPSSPAAGGPAAAARAGQGPAGPPGVDLSKPSGGRAGSPE
jgi:type IV pilus assembly protein PilO